MEEREEFLEAVKRGDVASVEGLLQRDRSLMTARNDKGISPLLLALYNGKPAVADVFIKGGIAADIFEAAAAGLAGRVSELLASDPAAVSHASPDGWTPLHLAAFFGRKLIVEFLLNSGAPIDAVSTNPQKVTPLHSALASHQEACALLLLNRGASHSVANATGYTPLHYSAVNNLVETTRLLLGRGANTAASTTEGETPLTLARMKGNSEITEMIIRERKIA